MKNIQNNVSPIITSCKNVLSNSVMYKQYPKRPFMHEFYLDTQ